MVQKWKFNDFDAFASQVRDVDCLMMVQCPKINQWKLWQAHAGQVEVQYGNLGTGNILEGTAWRSCYTFYLPLASNIQFHINGEMIGQNSFWLIEPGQVFSLSSNGAHSWCAVSVPLKLFTRSDLQWQRTRKVTNTDCRPIVTQVELDLVRRFWSIVQAVFSASKATSTFRFSPGGRQAEQDLIEICRSILYKDRQSGQETGRARLNRMKVIGMANRYIADVGVSSSRVDDMCKFIGISRRTLYNVFQDVYSVSPKCYLQTLQVRKMRDDLISADPDVQTVSEVMSNYGVYNFGQYASLYRDLYGELPSETLRRVA